METVETREVRRLLNVPMLPWIPSIPSHLELVRTRIWQYEVRVQTSEQIITRAVELASRSALLTVDQWPVMWQCGAECSLRLFLERSSLIKAAYYIYWIKPLFGRVVNFMDNLSSSFIWMLLLSEKNQKHHISFLFHISIPWKQQLHRDLYTHSSLLYFYVFFIFHKPQLVA